MQFPPGNSIYITYYGYRWICMYSVGVENVANAKKDRSCGGKKLFGNANLSTYCITITT